MKGPDFTFGKKKKKQTLLLRIYKKQVAED